MQKDHQDGRVLYGTSEKEPLQFPHGEYVDDDDPRVMQVTKKSGQLRMTVNQMREQVRQGHVSWVTVGLDQLFLEYGDKPPKPTKDRYNGRLQSAAGGG